MTDDNNNARYRSSDPYARTADPQGHGSDPLAELARLIGQSDPFSADHGREHHSAPRQPQPYDDPPPQADAYDDRPAYDSRYDAPYSPDPAPHFSEAAQQPHQAPAPEWHNPPSLDPFPAAAHPARDVSADRNYPPAAPNPPRAFEFQFPAIQPQHADQQHADQHHADHGTPSFDAGSRHGQGGMPSPLPFASDRAHSPPPHFSSDRAASPPPLDEYYDDAPQGGRRKGLITVVAVFCLAVVGTAGAFGYRTWFAGPSVKSTPAVIRASADPAKVAPPPSVDPNANKISYDRFGDRGQNEKVVLREEKPVDITARTGAAMSAVPLPSQPAPGAVPGAANPPSVLTDPKKVRTVTIRPDLPEESAARPPMVTPPAPARQTVAAVAPANNNAPLDLANPAAPAPRAAAVRPAPPPPPAVRPAPAAPSANAPLSLAPEANNAPPAAATRSAPTRVAAAPAAPAGNGNGSYLVQVSSQRSEADAQAAFRSVKSKYSSVLGDRQPVIRRADLAGKGTYYRAMVGPFGSRDQAIQLCSSLKAAGGDCVVQAN